MLALRPGWTPRIRKQKRERYPVLIDLDQHKNALTSDPRSVRVKAYHCTRAIRGDIASSGLKKFDLEERIQYLDGVLMASGLSRGMLDDYFSEVRRFISGQNLRGREGKICFCLNRALFEDDDGCDKLFRYFGGEALYKLAEHVPKFGEVREALEAIGEPLVVTASIPLNAMLPFQSDRVRRYLSGDNSECCEAFINVDVPPSDIMEIEVFNKYL